MSTQIIPQQSIAPGFSIDFGQVTYTASLKDWACLLRALNQIDLYEQLKDDLNRCLFAMWREGLRAAVLCGWGLSYFDSKELKQFKKEVAPLVDVGRIPEPHGLAVDESKVSYAATPEDWSFLCKALASINLDEMRMDDGSRTVLGIWRGAIRDAVLYCFDLAWLTPCQIEHLQDELTGV